MQIEHERGYLILAQNSQDTDYLLCARVLAKNIKQLEPNAKICLLTDDANNADPVFDFTRVFPFGDRSGDSEWKLHNDWQCFYASPFRQTIKIEADMYLPCSIQHWFDICQDRDLVVTVGARNYHNVLSKDRTYRKIIDANGFVDVYNAITYWRLSPGAKLFFDTVRSVMENWQLAMSSIRQGSSQPVNTDLAYAIALHLLGHEQYTLPGEVPSLIHLKPAINSLISDDWTRELVWEIEPGSFRINTVQQMYPVHYHVKEFAKVLEERLDG